MKNKIILILTSFLIISSFIGCSVENDNINEIVDSFYGNPEFYSREPEISETVLEPEAIEKIAEYDKQQLISLIDCSEEQLVCYLFNKKYDTEFISENVKIQSLANVNGQTVVESIIYDDANDIQYKVNLFKNDLYVTDDYAKTVYETIFNNDLNIILTDCLAENELNNIDYNMFYSMNKKAYTDIEQFDEYITKTDVHYSITVNTQDINDYLDKIYNISKALDDKNYQYTIILTDDVNQKTVHRNKENTSEYTVEDFILE